MCFLGKSGGFLVRKTAPDDLRGLLNYFFGVSFLEAGFCSKLDEQIQTKRPGGGAREAGGAPKPLGRACAGCLQWRFLEPLGLIWI